MGQKGLSKFKKICDCPFCLNFLLVGDVRGCTRCVSGRVRARAKAEAREYAQPGRGQLEEGETRIRGYRRQFPPLRPKDPRDRPLLTKYRGRTLCGKRKDQRLAETRSALLRRWYYSPRAREALFVKCAEPRPSPTAKRTDREALPLALDGYEEG